MTDAETTIQPSTEDAVNTVVNAQQKRGRNFSFLHKKPDTLDEVEINGRTFKIPAAAGSCYWGVLKVCYESHDQPVYYDDLTGRVAEVMEDRDERAWLIYTGKEKTTVFKSAGKEEISRGRVVQKIKPWQDRVINNAKTLTRLGGNSQYGMRLYERGHVLRHETDEDGKPYFILRTSLDCLTKKEKADADAEVADVADVADVATAPEE